MGLTAVASARSPLRLAPRRGGLGAIGVALRALGAHAPGRSGAERSASPERHRPDGARRPARRQRVRLAGPVLVLCAISARSQVVRIKVVEVGP